MFNHSVIATEFSLIAPTPSKEQGMDRFTELVDVALSLLTEEDLIENIYAATSEALSNAIKHGNNYRQDRTIDLRIVVALNYVEVIVADQSAKGFNYHSYVAPKDIAPLLLEQKALEESGRGILLMTCLADGIRYGLEGRKVTLVFKRRHTHGRRSLSRRNTEEVGTDPISPSGQLSDGGEDSCHAH